MNSMVVSNRGNKIRICLDPSDHNKAVKREHYLIPTLGAKIPDADFNLNCTNNYDVAKIKMKSVTDHQ